MQLSSNSVFTNKCVGKDESLLALQMLPTFIAPTCTNYPSGLVASTSWARILNCHKFCFGCKKCWYSLRRIIKRFPAFSMTLNNIHLINCWVVGGWGIPLNILLLYLIRYRCEAELKLYSTIFMFKCYIDIAFAFSTVSAQLVSAVGHFH